MGGLPKYAACGYCHRSVPSGIDRQCTADTCNGTGRPGMVTEPREPERVSGALDPAKAVAIEAAMQLFDSAWAMVNDKHGQCYDPEAYRQDPTACNVQFLGRSVHVAAITLAAMIALSESWAGERLEGLIDGLRTE